MDEITESKKKALRERQAEIIKILEALNTLGKSLEWNVLKEFVFDKSLASIERQMLAQSMNQEISTDKLYKLQGEWAWAKQYSNLEIFAESSKKQLEEIKKLLK